MADKTSEGLPLEPNQATRDGGNASEQTLTETRINEMISKAIGARLRDLDDRFEKLLEKKIAPSAAPAEKEVTAKQKPDPQLEVMATELKTLKEDRAKFRDKGLRSSVREELVKNSINPDVVDPLLAYYIDSKKAIGYASDDSDEVLVRIGENAFNLKEGIASLIKNDQSMKVFLAPKGAVGTGDSTYTPPKPTPEPTSAFSAWVKKTHGKV